MRQPVAAWLFEKPLIVTVSGYIDPALKWATPSYRKLSYTSSAMISRPWRSAIFTISRIVLSGMTAPLGFVGVFSMIALVFGVTAAATFAGSSWKVGNVSTKTGRAPK